MASISLVLASLFGSLSVAFHGIQTQNHELALIFTLYAVVLGVGILMTQGRILQGPPNISLETVALIALSYWAGRGIFHALGSLGSQSFTVFSAPTKSYLSFLGQAPFDVQVYVNQTLAATVENSAIIGGAALTVLGLMSLGVPAVVAFVVGAGVFSLAFAFLHGAVSLTFLLIAFIVMMIWMTLTIGADLEIVAIPILSSFPATVGLHQGNNIEAGDGVITYYETLWYAENLGFAGKATVLVEFLLLVLALYRLYLLGKKGTSILKYG